MKKIMRTLILAIFAMIAIPAFADQPAMNSIPVKPASRPPVKLSPKEEMVLLETRLNEINSMNKKDLTRSERRALKKEVQGIKGRMESLKDDGGNGGIYISTGVLLIILILIIIL